MRGWSLTRTGEPGDVLHLGPVDDVHPRRGQVSLDVEAVGLGVPDILQVQGKHQIALPLPCSPCSEVVGRVVAAGEGVALHPGDRVLGLAATPPGALRERTLMFERDLVPISPVCAAADAVSLPSNYVTGYLALHVRAKVVPGEVVVVHGGGGGVGSATIQLARAAGARVIACDLGTERVEFCRKLGADLAVDAAPGPAAVKAAVNEFTDGAGADVIVDVVGGDLFDESRRYVAPEGRVCVVGFMSGRIAELRTNQLILKNYTVMGVNAAMYVEDFPERHRAAREAVVGMLERHEIDPVIFAEFGFERALDAFAALSGGSVLGKTVITVP